MSIAGRHVVLGATALMALLASRAAAQRPTAAECYARHYAAYADAQRGYQRTVARLSVAADPPVSTLAGLARDEQIARIDARKRAVVVLLGRSPDEVHVDRAVNQWLDWGPAEAARLSRVDPTFARLDSAARAASSRVAGHADWARRREVVRGPIQRDSSHRAALARLTAAMRARPSCTPLR